MAKNSRALRGSKSPLDAARAYLHSKQKKVYENARVRLSDEDLKESFPHLPSGCDVIDFLIGGDKNEFGVAPCPGFPRGRVAQIWGHESAGKTTVALTCCASACEFIHHNGRPGSALYIDWENDIVPWYARALGVPTSDESRFELLQPETLEDGIKFAMTYAAAGVDLIVFDSVGAAVPRRLAERDALDTAEQGKMMELQAIWSQELPNLKRVIAQTGTAVIGISQTRASMAKVGKQTKPQGGNAWKFYSSVRMELRRVQNEKSKRFNALKHTAEERVVGGVIKAQLVKCKMSPNQGREEVFYIRWGEGIDNVRTTLEVARCHGIIKKSGSWLAWEDCPGGKFSTQGTEKFRQHLIDNPDKYDILHARVQPLLGQGLADEFEDEEVFDLDDVDGIGAILAGAAKEEGGE